MEQVLVCSYCDERVTDGIVFGSDMMHKRCHEAFGEELARIYKGEFEPLSEHAMATIEADDPNEPLVPPDTKDLLAAFAEVV